METLFRITVAALLLTTPALAQQPPKGVTVTPIFSSNTTSSGQPITLPQKDVQVQVSMYQVEPGATLPVHKHPYPRYGYMLSGNLRITNLETNQTITFKPGDFIIEAEGQWHMAQSTGGDPVKLLVVDLVEHGHNNTILKN